MNEFYCVVKIDRNKLIERIFVFFSFCVIVLSQVKFGWFVPACIEPRLAVRAASGSSGRACSVVACRVLLA